MKREVIVLVPYPAQGHVTPIIQLAIALHGRGFQPVIINADYIHKRLVASRVNDIDGLLFLSIPDGLPECEPRNFFNICFAMENNMPHHLHLLLDTLQGGESRVACLVVDLLASWAVDIASHRGIPVAGFWPAMLPTYHLISAIPDMIHAGIISQNGSPQWEGMVRLLPSLPVLSSEDLPWLVGNQAQRKSRFAFWLKILQRTASLHWLLVNSFTDENCNQQQQSPLVTTSVLFQVGPVLSQCSLSRNPSLWEEDWSCLDWLGRQKSRSVIYVSFGSWVGPISEAKVGELALGLEATGMPFIWVLGSTWRGGLPSGYLDRIATTQGKVVTWAPQKEVLRHKAVGCFLTHCGWNSTVEAIEGGKPLLCYPVAGDQFLNSRYVVHVWRIGVQVGGNGRRQAVEEAVRKVMENGSDMEKRMMELKDRFMGEEAQSRAAATLSAFLDSLNGRPLCVADCPSQS